MNNGFPLHAKRYVSLSWSLFFHWRDTLALFVSAKKEKERKGFFFFFQRGSEVTFFDLREREPSGDEPLVREL